MDIPFQLPTTIYAWISVFTAIVVGVLFIRRSDIKGLHDDNDELRKRIDDKDGIIKDLQIQLNTFREELAKLRGMLEEKDKRIDALSHVNFAMPPEMTTYMQDVRNFMSQSHQWMLATTETLTELNQRAKMKV